jgi:hypothetical protein
MVFGRAEAKEDTNVETRPASSAPALPLPLPMPEPFELSEIVKQAPGTPGVLPGLSDRRREAWEDDGAEVGQALWREEDGRLGVLPSPSVQESIGAGRKGSWIGEPVVTPLEEDRGEEDAAERGEKPAARDSKNMSLLRKHHSWSKRLRLCQQLRSLRQQMPHCPPFKTCRKDAHLWHLSRTVHPGVMSVPAHPTPCLLLPWLVRRRRGKSVLSMSCLVSSVEGSTRHLPRHGK